MSRLNNTRLRLFHQDDFDAFHALVSDYDVVKMLGTWPYPADPEFTRMRMTTPEVKAGMVNIVEVDGKLAGSVAIVKGGLGYMLGKSFWGQGIGSWATKVKVANEFRETDIEKIEAGAWDDNPASAKVLLKNGFRKTGELTDFCKARDCDMTSHEFVLTRDTWNAQQPFRIETDRLIMTPFVQTDAKALSKLMDTRYVTDMMVSIPAPFYPGAASEWIAARQYDNEPGFAVKITLKDGSLIGFAYLHDHPTWVAYAIGEPHKGQGYATEAASAFLTECAQRFALSDITAGAFADNPASQRVLDKLGFKRIGERMHKTTTRLEPGELYLYRLRRNIRKHHEIS